MGLLVNASYVGIDFLDSTREQALVIGTTNASQGVTPGVRFPDAHQSIFTVGKSTFLAFHAWAATKGCRKAADKRFLYIAPLSWKDGKPVIVTSLRARGK